MLEGLLCSNHTATRRGACEENCQRLLRSLVKWSCSSTLWPECKQTPYPWLGLTNSMCGFFQMRSFEALRKARSAEFYAICDVAEVLAEKMAAVHGPHDPAKALRWIQAQRPHGNPSETDTRIAAERRSGRAARDLQQRCPWGLFSARLRNPRKAKLSANPA